MNTTQERTMRLIKTELNYNYWIGINRKGVPYYNVIPENQGKPSGGYYSSEYICKLKNVPNYFLSY